MVATPKTYRMTARALQQLDMLSTIFKTTDTDILHLALEQFYEREMARRGTRLISRDGNRYDVQINHRTVATVPTEAVEGLPQEMIRAMLQEGEPSGFGMIVLNAQMKGIEFDLYPDELKRTTEKGG